MPAAFSFDGFQIKNLEYRLNEQEERTLASRDINFQIGVSSKKDDKNRYRIELKTEVSGNPEIKLSLFGFLTSTDYFDKNEEIESAKMIGASILYPYARSIISSISAQDSSQGIILPTINLLELFSDKNPYEDKAQRNPDDNKNTSSPRPDK